MSLREVKMAKETGKKMYRLADRLFPICRSITGNGVRDTLRIVQDIVPLEIHEVPTGTEVFDLSQRAATSGSGELVVGCSVGAR